MASDRTETANAKPLRLGNLADSIGFRMRRLHNHLGRGFDQHAETQKLRAGSASALALIAANPGVTQQRIAAEIGVDKSYVQSIVTELESAGWVDRAREESDRRKVGLRISAQGEAALTPLSAAIVETEARALALLSPEERAMLAGLLDRMHWELVRTAKRPAKPKARRPVDEERTI